MMKRKFKGDRMFRNSTRRQFLKRFGAPALVGLALPPLATKGQAMTTSIIDRLNARERDRTPFAVRTSFKVKPELLTQFLEQASEVAIFTSSKDRPLSYRFYQDLNMPEEIVLFQEWADPSTFDRHLKTSHAKAFSENLTTMLASSAATKIYRSSTTRKVDGAAVKQELEVQTDTTPSQPLLPKIIEQLRSHDNLNKQFVLNVDLPVKATAINIMLDAANKAVEPTMQEAGNIRYGYYQDVENPTSFLLFEHWKDADAQAQHVDEPQFQQLLPAFGAASAAQRTFKIYRPLPF
jgi:quinol monooxygenase YgiN